MRGEANISSRKSRDRRTQRFRSSGRLTQGVHPALRWPGERARAGLARIWPTPCFVRGMSKPIPTIQKYMTTAPHSIGDDQPLAKAAGIMKKHNIRHLPVLRAGKLLGILTDRDIRLIESLVGVDATTLAVAEVMTEEPYAVDPNTPLDEVTGEMAHKKYGSAVVVQNHKVVGIFTTVDACEALSELLRTRLSN